MWRINTDEWLRFRRNNREKKILVVDDEGFLLDVLFEVLDSHGYTVLTATSGEEALAMAKKAGSIDLLLTDLIMKPMNGPQLSQELKQTNPQMKVLFMSGYTEEYIRENLGLIIPFLAKPISSDALLERIPEVLRSETSSDQRSG